MGTYFCEDSQMLRERHLAHWKWRSSGPKSPCFAHEHIHCAVTVIIQYGFIIIETYKRPYYMRTNIAPSLKQSKANYSWKAKKQCKNRFGHINFTLSGRKHTNTKILMTESKIVTGSHKKILLLHSILPKQESQNILSCNGIKTNFTALQEHDTAPKHNSHHSVFL